MNYSKNMIPIGMGVSMVLIAAYLAPFGLRIAIPSMAPFAAALIFPLSVLLMMKMMSSAKQEQEKEKALVSIASKPVKPEQVTF